MQSLRALAIVALLALTSLGQTIEVKPFEALVAKSVKVEQLIDSVAVILDGTPIKQTGAYLRIASDKKWATPILDGVTITQTATPGEWILFTKPGKYRLLLAEFDAETGPRYSYHDLIIGGSTTPDPKPDPDKPVDPPAGDYAELINVAKSIADLLADPKTRAALASAYRSVNLTGLSYDDSVNAVRNARQLVLSARQGESRNKDWDAWRNAVDLELRKIVQPGDKAAYANALQAIVKALES
jgi:hypothetical protein